MWKWVKQMSGRQGQSMIEYTLVVLVVVVVILAVMKTALSPKLQDSYNRANDVLNRADDEFNNAYNK